MTVEELRRRLEGVDGSRVILVQVINARRSAQESYSESGDDGRVFIISD